MSDVMLFGVLRMPYELAMGGELSRFQYWSYAQEAAQRIEADAAELERLRAEVEALRVDAERYRWLRGGHGSAAAAQHEEATDKGWERVNWMYDEDVDAVVDAEMRAAIDAARQKP